MRYYITTDTHFNHDNIKLYCNRPDDYELRITRGLEILPEDAILIHLGDVCIGDDKKVHKDIIAPLACKKILVRGNHDSKSNNWYMDHGWDFVCERFDSTLYGHKIAFTHQPIPWDGNFDFNLHGHLHNLGHRDNPTNFKNILFSLEIDGYGPWSLEAFLGKKLKEERNEHVKA